MTVVITEKPSVARDLAAFLGASQKGEGFFHGNGCKVTWAFGHLVSLKDPEEYNPAWKKWSVHTLPLFPERFELKSVADKGSQKQLKVIGRLLNQANRLIAATDAGREGELIFRNILRYLGKEDLPFERLWLSSLTPEAIQEAFDQLKPAAAYENLYHAARCRSEADWIVGINGTRNLTVRFGQKTLWSLGRVQTPVLAMLAERDDEIATFIPEPYWELYTTFNGANFKYTGKRFDKKTDAEKLLEAVLDHPFVISKVQKKREKNYPPLLFDLTELQREMNKRFGLTAKDTLAAAQNLYESKLLTYPRTDSQYLPEDFKVKIPSTLRQLSARFPSETSCLDFNKLPFSKRLIDSSKVSDHHAIIPTGKKPGQLPAAESSVFDAVALRLIASFYPPCEKDVVTVEGISNKKTFRAKGATIVALGWTALYQSEQKEKDKEKEEEQTLPVLHQGDTGPHTPFIKEGKTSPPKPYTENSLLGSMATAGKQIEDEELKNALKDKGLGTPATRAAIIETLITRKYIKRSKKTLAITPHGRYLIALVQDPELKSAELTGNWEAKLKQMEKGAFSPQQFMEEIKHFTTSFIAASDITKLDTSRLGSCPLCQSAVIKGKKGYGCSKWKEGCSFVIWKEYNTHLLTDEHIRKLLQKNIVLPPLTAANGEKTALALTSKGKVIELPVP